LKNFLSIVVSGRATCAKADVVEDNIVVVNRTGRLRLDGAMHGNAVP
jgi:hypothetical protein